MTNVEITDEFKKILHSFKKGETPFISKLLDKIEFCLEKHLYEYLSQCDKKRLHGSKEGVCRLHYQKRYTIFYKVNKDSVLVYDLMGFEEAHQKYGRVL